MNRSSYLRNILLLAFYLIANIQESICSNWAQTSGKIEQNIVVTEIPAPDKSHWSARYGHATVIMHSGKRPDIGEVYILGGDSNDGNYAQDSPGLLDKSRTKGYMNDVWKTTGTEWEVSGDIRLRSDFRRERAYTGTPKTNQKIPRVYSHMQWIRRTPGMLPNPGVTYDDWIICLDNFDAAKYYAQRDKMRCCEKNRPSPENCVSGIRQWSPRRNLQAIAFTPTNNQSYATSHPEWRGVEAIFVMGGRARELHTFDEERTVGGILDPRVRDVGENQGLDKATQLFTSQREASVYKSDVWRSIDGANWDLVTPGCRAPQASLVAQGNIPQGKKGTVTSKCKGDQDCYGAEKCEIKISELYGHCYCPMWTSRELFGLAAHNGFMYVVGGYASHLYSLRSNCGAYACGDSDASSYRAYMSDVWSSPDGETWKLLTQQAEFEGRGGHQLLLFPFPPIPMKFSSQYLWVIGGRGGDSDGNTKDVVYFNDIWRAVVTVSSDQSSTSVGTWESVPNPNGDKPMWSPRTGHTAVLETGVPSNGNIRTLHVIGGQTEEGFSDEVWTWQLDNPVDFWRKDWSPEQYYRVGTTTPNNMFKFALPTPAADYIAEDLDLTYLKRFFIPLKSNKQAGAQPEKRSYLTDARIELLNKHGIKTIADMANADIYTILALRGYKPGMPRKSGFALPKIDLTDPNVYPDVCDVKYLAKVLIITR